MDTLKLGHGFTLQAKLPNTKLSRAAIVLVDLIDHWHDNGIAIPQVIAALRPSAELRKRMGCHEAALAKLAGEDPGRRMGTSHLGMGLMPQLCDSSFKLTATPTVIWAWHEQKYGFLPADRVLESPFMHAELLLYRTDNVFGEYDPAARAAAA